MTQQRSEKQTTLASSQKLNIDWQQVCQAIWKNSLSINPLTTQPKETEAQGKDIYLSIGLIGQQKPKSRQSYNMWAKPHKTDSTEIIQKYSQQEFFQQILSLGKSKTRGRRLAIIGKSCTGKTTILNQIITWILNNTEDLPIWISIAEMGETPLHQYLKEKWIKRVAKTEDELTREWQNSLDELLNSGRVWLLLDGVENLPIEQIEKIPITPNFAQTKFPLLLDPLSAIIQQLEGWTDKTRIILTCNSNLFSVNKTSLSNFDIFRPLDLTYPKEVKEFIYYWFSQNSAEKTSHHSRKLEKLTAQVFSAIDQFGVARIGDLVQTPLKLSLLCRLAQHQKGILPTTLGKLYEQLVTQYYQWQGETIPLNSQQKINQMLGKIAIQAMENAPQRNWIYHHQIIQLLGEDDSLLKLFLGLGWLKVIGITADNQETIYTFWDETFQAYFAATFIDDWKFFLNHILGNINSLASTSLESSYRIFESAWKRVILLWMGREDIKREDKEAFLQSLVEFTDGCDTENLYGKRAYFLAASTLVEFPESEQSKEILLELLQWSFFDTQVSPVISAAAKAALSETNKQWAISALIQLLKTIKNETIKRDIFKNLEQIGGGNPRAINTLSKMLETTPVEPLRWQIAESLGIINPGDSQAIATIISLLETANQEETRQIAFKTLEKIGKRNFKAITTLIKLLQTTDSVSIRQRAFETLEIIGYENATAIAALVQLIRTNSDEGIRRQAAESLEKIDSGNPTAITVLTQLIYNASNEEIRKQAVYSIGEITSANSEAINALIKMLSPDNDIFLRWMAISSLGKIGKGNPQAIEALVKLIKSDEQGLIRKDAIENLVKLDPDNSEAITALVSLTESSYDESTRREAAENLGKLAPSNEQGIVALLQLLHSTKDEFTRHQAAFSLGKIEPGNLEALKTLIQLVQSSDDADVRSLAAESLGEIGAQNPAVLAALIRLTKTTREAKILKRAILSLAQVGREHREVISALIQIIKSTQDESCRLQAAESLINVLKPEQMSEVVASCKEILSTSETKKDLACQKVIWHCAQHLSYPDFYQAWHNRPLYRTPKVSEAEPQIPEKTILEPANSQTPKLSGKKLAQLLQTRINEKSSLAQTVRFVVIDSNDLIDPDNPFVDIYDLMLAQKCPGFDYGLPDTMAKLRLYWNTIQRNEPNLIFGFVFFENLSEADSQGFSSEFLKMLSKFSGAICLITEKTGLKLPIFSPQDPNLIENIISISVGWGASALRGFPPL